VKRKGVAILAGSAAIQVAVATIPATMGDLVQYRSWTRTLTSDGLAAAYWHPTFSVDSLPFNPPIDYPPLFPYALSALGHALQALSPAALGNDWLLDFLIRVPLIVSSLLLALLVYLEVRRFAPSAADLALALVAFNPALIFATAYWGQADAPCALFILASVVALVRGRPEWAWAALTTAALVKPFAYPLAPLMAFETVRRFGISRTLRAAGASLVVGCVAFLPFLPAGRALDALWSLVTQVDVMPYISVNAHNLWWLVGRGAPWTNAHASPFGLVEWGTLGLLLFATLYLATLALLWRSREPRSLYAAAATVSFGFFVLSTHMHENHLLYALPLLTLAGAESKRVRMALYVLTAATLANMALHDPLLTHWARAHTPGPHIVLPSRLAPELELRQRLTRLGYPWIAEQLRGESTLLGSLATLVNAQAVIITFLSWLVFLWRSHGFDATLRASYRPPRRDAWGLALAFVLATGAPFVDRVLHYEREHYFLLHFEDARIDTKDAARVSIDTFDLGGDRRDVLFVHPPSDIGYSLTLPAHAVLHTALALKPSTWTPERGDGVDFKIWVEDEGKRHIVLSRYLDPKHNPADRRWEPVIVDLSAFAGRSIVLTFATTGGPAGNIDFDWAGFSDPRIETR
jgi:Gpi18-like mannosyltransferase